ncbi:MAG: LysR family transcriptional regulator [Rhodospirillales bacterium]|nr:LysR family transcriptional regulator [Rhodospirillales bacterium]
MDCMDEPSSVGAIDTQTTSSSWRESVGRTRVRNRRSVAMAIELRHLQHTVAASQHGSFRRAAAALHVRQSTLSRRIRQMEEQLGVVLFDRSSGGVRLTPAGIRVTRTAARLLEDLDALLSTAKAMGRGEAGRLALGLLTSPSAAPLQAVLLDYALRFPDVEILLVQKLRPELMLDLKTGALDLAIVTGEAKEQGNDESLSLWSEGVVVALPRAHPLAARAFLYWTDLKEENFLLSRHGPGPIPPSRAWAAAIAPTRRSRPCSGRSPPT